MFCFLLAFNKWNKSLPVRPSTGCGTLNQGLFLSDQQLCRVSCLHLTLSGHNDGYYWCQSGPVMEGKCLMLSGLIFSFSPLGRWWGRRLVNLSYFFIFAARKRGFAGRRQGTGFTAPPPRPSVRPSATPTCGPLKRRLV